jgi:septal ring factor EnvC (AmiA/AmiB activator)
MTDLLTVVVTGLLSGGIGAGIATLIKARSEARNLDATAKAIDAKLPVEVDSIVVQGAESAVLTMRSALESASARIAELEQDRAEDRKRIAELESKVRELELKVHRAEEALTEARDAGRELRQELAAFSRDRDTRR